MYACCTVHPSEAPEHLGLRVLRARGCRGGKQWKVGWSKTMVWPPSAPSQMCLGRGARNQIARVCCEHVRNAGVRPPSDSEPGMAGSGRRVSALCCAGRRKIDRCRGCRVLRTGSGLVGALGLSRWCSYGKKRRNCSMFQELVRMLPSESFSL